MAPSLIPPSSLCVEGRGQRGVSGGVQMRPKRLCSIGLFLFDGLGRVIESPHPLKDNYKLKETVHIPGARCLYLKFDSKERHLSVLYD